MTQPAINNYLNSKRAKECEVILGAEFVLLNSLACETANNLSNGKTTTDEMKKNFCNLCMKLREDSCECYNI